MRSRPKFAGILASIGACGLVMVCDVAVAQTRPTLAAKGRVLLDKNCSRCHALGAQGASAHATAPPFRDVAKRYPPASLAEALAEGIVSGHPDMPEIAFEPAEIDAIVAYLETLGDVKQR